MIHSLALPFAHGNRLTMFRMLSTLTVGIIVFAVAQDFFQSLRNNYSFYLSESLLFKSFWIFFLPVAYCGLRLTYDLFSKKENQSFPLKILVFTGFAAPTHAFLFSLAVYLLSAIFFDHTYSVVDNLTYTFSNDGVLYLLVYGGIVFFAMPKQMARVQPWNHTEQNRTERESSQAQVDECKNNLDEQAEYHAPVPHAALQHTLRQILVGTTKHRVAVPLDDIICITSSAPYIAIHTKKKEHLHAETLKSLHETLPLEHFVRIHKSSIVNIREVVSYTSRLNGDYDIMLVNRQEVRLSRNYAKEFKEKFERYSGATPFTQSS